MNKIVLTIAVAVSVVLSVVRALNKPFWYDELLTLYVCSLRSPLEQWQALLRGADGAPPAFYWITSLLAWLPINPHLAYRLPAVAGWGLALIGVYVFLSRRLGSMLGLCGSLLLALSPVAMYATEARPYGLMLGLTAFAAICWQRLEDGKRWTFLLAVSLLILTSVHYLAPLIVLCFAEAELLRSAHARSIRRSAWGAFILSAIPPILTSPILLTMNREIGHSFWSKPHVSDIPSYWGASLAVTPGTIVVLLPICLFLLLREIGQPSGPGQPAVAARQSERMLSVALLLLPLQGFLLAIAVDGGFHPRYVQTFIVGGCCALPLLMEKFSEGTVKLIAACLLLVLAVPGGYRIAANRGAVTAELHGRSVPALAALAQVEDTRTPLVVSDELQYLEALYYGGKPAADRLYYLGTKEMFSRFGMDVYDRPAAIIPAQNSHTLGVIDFLRDHTTFSVLASSKHPLNWVPEYLIKHGWRMEFRSVIDGGILYAAVPPARVETSASW
ncbi:MAG: glycosyltransferase family 39 protein [Acidobacteria bacterium]|nr:glycosyltransferase family 39 protein [Acidobacteriota bacterium]